MAIDRIADEFQREFAPWGLRLPPGDLDLKRSGYIHAHGWLVQYVFGQNRRGKYLDYYASHRMTDDRHERIYATGARQRLAVIIGMHLTSEDPTEAARLEAAHSRRNRRVARALVAKGFNRFTMNMALRADLEERR